MHLFLRFIIGGFFVAFFSIVGDSVKPQSFAGLFGAAPSIALAGLILIWTQSGGQIAATEAKSMILGSVAMNVYCIACAFFLRRTQFRPWLVAGGMWLLWLAVAVALYLLVLK